MGIRGKYLRLTEQANALDYLERAADFIRETDQDVLAWKWVVLSLHGALYGFAICACRGTNYENVIWKKKKTGQGKLIPFDEALHRCQDRNCIGTFSGRPLVLSASQKESIELLKKALRNRIEHYVPGLWSIEIHGMPHIAIDALDIIRFLAIETRTASVHLNQSQIKRIKSCVFQSKKFLKNSTLYREVMMSEADDQTLPSRASDRRGSLKGRH